MNSEMKYYIVKNHIEKPVFYDKIMLFQLGRMHCKGATVVEEHIHRTWFELTVVTDGSGDIITNGSIIPIKKGQIYLSFPADIHSIISSETSPMKFNFFSFYSEDAEIKQHFEKIIQDHISPDMRIISDDKIEYLVNNAIAEINSENEFSNNILFSIFNQIIWYLIRDFSKEQPQNSKLHINYYNELCYRLMNYIDTHLFTMESLYDLAKAFGYNYSYLSNVFSNHTNDTLNNYYQERRLKAAEILVRDGLSVTEIAEILNYSSIYTFSRAFKNKYGLSPLKYLKTDT